MFWIVVIYGLIGIAAAFGFSYLQGNVLAVCWPNIFLKKIKIINQLYRMIQALALGSCVKNWILPFSFIWLNEFLPHSNASALYLLICCANKHTSTLFCPVFHSWVFFLCLKLFPVWNFTRRLLIQYIDLHYCNTN